MTYICHRTFIYSSRETAVEDHEVSPMADQGVELSAMLAGIKYLE